MSYEKLKAGRRSFLMSAAAAAIVGTAPAARADTISSAQLDPWAARELNSSERNRLAALSDHLHRSLQGVPVEAKVLPDHLRLRIPASIAYVPGEDALTPDGVAIMTLVAEQLTYQKLVRIEIVGHHDTRARDYDAYMFTRRRAMSAKAALTSRGIDGDRLKVTGLGTKFPYTTGASPENQRIELIIRPL